PEPVAVGILLIWVRNRPAVIHGITNGVAVAVDAGSHARVARVPEPIVVAVDLLWVRRRGAVVERTGVRGETRVSESISVGIRAGIARVALTVVVLVQLVWIRRVRTIIASVRRTIPVRIVSWQQSGEGQGA